MKRQLLQYMFFLSAFVMAGNMASAQQNSPGPVLNYYVDAANGSDTNDGLAWGTAFKTLSKALDLANANSTNEIEIHVAEGVYKPTNWANLKDSQPDVKGDRDFSFVINRNFVKLWGGYPAGGGARNSIENPTILSGDIGVENDDSDNCYHVMIITPTVKDGANYWTDKNTIVDGFVLTKGNANGQMKDASTSGYIRDILNRAIWKDTGGALYVSGRDGTATNSPVFRDCIFKDNKSTNGGGAVNVQGYTNTIQPAFINCVFEGNTTTGNGGAILANSRDGGRSINSKYMLRNSLFINNSATGEGGAIYNQYHDTYIINSTFYNNTAGTIGGAISNNTSYRQNYFNTIFWGNTANGSSSDISNINTKYAFLMKNSLVQTASFAGSDGNVQLVGSPFKDTGNPVGADGKWMTVDDGLVPKADFPGIDAADETDYSMVPDGGGDALYNGTWYGVDAGNAATDLDLRGAVRKSGAGLDIGAYEFNSTLPVSLLSFTAEAEAEQVRFVWKTASESENNRFEVERSADGKSFIPAAVVPAKGAGIYTAYDKNPLSGINYYRLVQYDQDGTRNELAIKSVNFSLVRTAVSIYPNPAADRLNISLGDYNGKAAVVLSDLSGRVLHTGNYEAQPGVPVQIQLPAQAAPGTYLLRISGRNLNEVQKIIKN